MSSNRDTEIVTLIERLKDDVRAARNHSLDHTARLLQMALLDLQMVLYEIPDDDLHKLADHLEEVSRVEEWNKQC